MLLLSLFAPPSVVSLRSTEQLNRIANRAIKVGRHQDALKCCEPLRRERPCRTPLLHALHLQRMQRPSAQVRAAFSQGAFIDRGNRGCSPSSSSRGASSSRSRRRWAAPCGCSAARCTSTSKATCCGGGCSAPPSTRSSAATASARARAPAARRGDDGGGGAARDRRAPAGAVHGADPEPRLARAAERDEDPAKWYDAQGVREGPPRNYWRQSLDERTHRAEMRVIDLLVGGGSGDELREACEELEYRMGIKAPQRHRKLLGPWAPLATSGARIATAGDGGGLRAPALRASAATAPRGRTRTGGEFDANLDAGEAVAFELRDCEGRTAVTVEAAAADTERRLVVGADAAQWSADGSITYLSDYLLIQRRDRDDGETPRDVWVRVVDGDPSAPVYPY